MTNETTQESVGSHLKQQREAQKLSLKDISDAINVRTGQLIAIEEGNLKDLPGMVYAVGFVRSYATHLGIDSDEAVARFKQEHANAAPAQPELAVQTPEQENQLPTSFMLTGAGIGLFLVITIWFVFLKTGTPAEEKDVIPNVPVHLQADVSDTLTDPTLGRDTKDILGDLATTDTPKINTENASQDTAITVAKNTQPTAPVTEPVKQIPVTNTLKQPKTPRSANKTQAAQTFGVPRSRSRVSLKSVDSSWVQIRDKTGKSLFQKVLRPGQIYRAPKEHGLKLTTANAGGLEVYVDGKKVEPFGKKGDIIHGISLNPADITKRKKKR